MKSSISSVSPTRKYSLTRFSLACFRAHWLPGTQHSAACPQKNGICSHMLRGSQSDCLRSTHSSKVCKMYKNNVNKGCEVVLLFFTCHFIAGLFAHQIRPEIVAKSQKIIVWNQPIQRLPYQINVYWLLRYAKLGKVQKSHVAVVQRRLDRLPAADVAYELHLIGQRQHVHVGRHIDV